MATHSAPACCGAGAFGAAGRCCPKYVTELPSGVWTVVPAGTGEPGAPAAVLVLLLLALVLLGWGELVAVELVSDALVDGPEGDEEADAPESLPPQAASVRQAMAARAAGMVRRVTVVTISSRWWWRNGTVAVRVRPGIGAECDMISIS